MKKLQQVPDKCPQVPSAWDGVCPRGGLWAVSSLLQRMPGVTCQQAPSTPQNGEGGCLHPKGGLGCGGDCGARGAVCCPPCAIVQGTGGRVHAAAALPRARAS